MTATAITPSSTARLYTWTEVEAIVAPWREMLVEAHLRQAALIRTIAGPPQDAGHWAAPSWREAAVDYHSSTKGLRR
jgi:hypothetical protein